MPEKMPDFASMSHPELVRLCEAFWQELQRLGKRVEKLEQDNQSLKANKGKIPKTSENSSLPPSKDQKANCTTKNGLQAVENSTKAVTEKRTYHHKGGRKLHPNPNQEVVLRPDVCVHCGAYLLDGIEKVTKVYDKLEIPEITVSVTRVKQIECQCAVCQQTIFPEVPQALGVESLFGENLLSLLCHLRHSQAIGYKRLSELCSEVFGVEVSQGSLSNALSSAYRRLLPRVAEIKAVVQKGAVIKSDETSARVSGKKHWEWVFVAKDACLHILSDSRSKATLQEVFPNSLLEQYQPMCWVSDLYKGQGFALAKKWQICLAHQIRDCQFAIDSGDTIFAPVIQELFREAIHLHNRKHELADSTFQKYRLQTKQKLTNALLQKPQNAQGKNLLRRYLEFQDSLLTFLDYDDVPPTNNESEQRLRWSVIFRKVTNGSRAEWGAKLFMAWRSVVNTGAKHGYTALESLRRALRGTLLPALPIGVNSS
jgi:transposase